MVMTNPPFGKKSSVLVVNEEGEQERQALTVVRDDFWASTTNKQLNFVQHVKTILKINGRAAIVVPDNVLFEGGAGETVRRKLLHECEPLRQPGRRLLDRLRSDGLSFADAKQQVTRSLWLRYDSRGSACGISSINTSGPPAASSALLSDVRETAGFVSFVVSHRHCG